MRSCASDRKISHGASPWYFSGAFSRWTTQPPASRLISPKILDSPPAPSRPKGKSVVYSADQEIDQIILSGGCARISNLDGFLKERLNMEVEINDPFRNIEINAKKFDPQYISENAPLAAVGIGLALRKVGDR